MFASLKVYWEIVRQTETIDVYSLNLNNLPRKGFTPVKSCVENNDASNRGTGTGFHSFLANCATIPRFATTK
jgi:hypothetical protein